MRENQHDTGAATGGKPEKEIPDLFLERYLLGELPAAEKIVFELRLASDHELRTRLDVLRGADEEFARTHDARILVHGLRERARRETLETKLRLTVTAAARSGSENLPGFAGWKPLLGGAFLLALVAIPAWRVLNGTSSTMVRPEVPEQILETQSGTPETTAIVATPPKSGPENVMVAPNPQSPQTDAGTPPDRIAQADASPDEDATRLKGYEPGLALFRRTEQGAEPLKPGDLVKPGDVVRIGYRAGGLSFGAIFSVDGNGNVTRHWPASGDRAVRLGKGETLLPGAFELDAAPDYERFYLVTAKKAFDLKPVLEALHASKTPARDDVTVVRFDLLKENGI